MQVAVARVAERADSHVQVGSDAVDVVQELGDLVGGDDDVHLVEQFRIVLDDGEERAARCPDRLLLGGLVHHERVVGAVLHAHLEQLLGALEDLVGIVAVQRDQDVGAHLFALDVRREDVVAGMRRRCVDDIAFHEFD